MKFSLAIVLAAMSASAHAGCMHVLDDAPTTIAEFRDNGVKIANVRKIMADAYKADDERPYALAMVDAIYGSKVKPWDAQRLAAPICGPKAVTASNDGLSEDQRARNYRDSQNRMPNIPGVCVGEDCNHIRKIQRWDANGNMIN